jgi:dTDP-4-dehydrorhamnose reductase
MTRSLRATSRAQLREFPMRVMITGHTGQLGAALHRLRPDAIGVSRAEMDLAHADSIAHVVQAIQPELIVHCAAWTDLDEAARRPEDAYGVNALGTQHLARAAAKLGATMVYISTNEVFDGVKTAPYFENDLPNPINAYGISKADGEALVQQALERYYIIRISWLTSPMGCGFLHRIQQLADEQSMLRVVMDEVASPTFVHDLAPAIWRLVQTGRFGVYHLTNQGYCSRYAFARRFLDLTGRSHIALEPITRAQFGRASTPPAFTPLANTRAAELGITLPDWQEALQAYLERARPLD